jgi:hypothetical protein
LQAAFLFPRRLEKPERFDHDIKRLFGTAGARGRTCDAALGRRRSRSGCRRISSSSLRNVPLGHYPSRSQIESYPSKSGKETPMDRPEVSSAPGCLGRVGLRCPPSASGGAPCASRRPGGRMCPQETRAVRGRAIRSSELPPRLPGRRPARSLHLDSEMAILNAIERLQAKAPAAGQKVPPSAPAVARCSGRDALPASRNYVPVIPLPAGTSSCEVALVRCGVPRMAPPPSAPRTTPVRRTLLNSAPPRPRLAGLLFPGTMGMAAG